MKKPKHGDTKYETGTRESAIVKPSIILQT